MGRLIYGEASDRVDPPEPEYKYTVECPYCGTELHEGDLVYQKRNYKTGAYTIFACENCIDDFGMYVEDL